jgi:hypothetical protein
MKLYVCWGTFRMGPHTHPCQAAHQALLDAGYDPEVKKVYGLGPLPKWMNPKRREVRALTGGSQWVPVLAGDDGELLGRNTAEIVAWAKANPASQG